MSNRHSIFRGAFILTSAGFISRFIGFFYRIFLSQVYGETGVGIYQLIFPVFALGFSLSCAGIEIAISRNVARKSVLHQFDDCYLTMYVGCFFSIITSIIFLLLVQNNASFIATYLLKEEKTIVLLQMLVYALPFAALHSSICGYFLGLKHAKIPALSQLVEQSIRVGSVVFLYWIFTKKNMPTTIVLAVIGLCLGEIGSSFYCFLSFQKSKKASSENIFSFRKLCSTTKELLTLSLPLTGNRVLLNLLQSVETISIPFHLQIFGYNPAQALKIYGVLSGMALPCVLFPLAITNALSSMVLPTVAEFQSQKKSEALASLVQKIILFCSSLGILSAVFLIATGTHIGNFLFHSNLAGDFIKTLAWICPFLYTNGNLISIINGLGHTFITFLFNAISLSIRILGIYIFIPSYGIRGYLSSLLISQIILFICNNLYLFGKIKKNAS